MDISDSDQSTRDFADGVKWLKANESVLRDTHWIGGDSWANGGGVYGYASYLGEKKRGKGIIILRNAAAEPKTLSTSLCELLELKGLPRAKAQVSDLKVLHSHDATFPTPETAASPLEVKFAPFGLVLVEVVRATCQAAQIFDIMCDKLAEVADEEGKHK